MKRDTVKKILILLVVIGLFFVQSYTVKATNLNQILGENGEDSSLNTNTTNTDTTNTNTADTNTTNTNTTNTNTTNTNTTNTTNTNTNNTNTTLPTTGANENTVIALIVICAVAGIYTFKKVKEYNM